MLILTTGRIVDLSTQRSKYHALKHPGPGPDVAHKALYPLVDVIYRLSDENGIPKRGWTEYDYVYSGYTLADIYKSEDWSDIEKDELYKWVTHKTQRICIETARRRLIENQGQLSVKYYSAPRYLYSTLQTRLKKLPLKQAKTLQWQATINNMQRSGIRQEEIIWSGLNDFLSMQNKEQLISKEQILKAINFTNIRIELSIEQIWGTGGGLSFREVAQQMPHQVVYRAALKLDDSCLCIMRYIDDTCNYRIGVIKTLKLEHDMSLNKCWFALDPYGRAIINPKNNKLFYDNSNAAMMAAEAFARDEFGLRSGAKNHTRYDHLTLYGGYNYKEWIISLPDFQRSYFGAHHFDHNVLIHLRTTTRHDHLDRKLLFIEEVQSDWHQTGQVKGYTTSYWGQIANAPFKKEWPALAVKLLLIHASQNGFDGIAWPKGYVQEIRYSKQFPAIKRHYDNEIPKALNQLGQPFNCHVEKTKIETLDPWLNLVRLNNKWRVSDNSGKFQTRDKYNSREEALQVLNRHSKKIKLPVFAYIISTSLRQKIASHGLPMFGETMK